MSCQSYFSRITVFISLLSFMSLYGSQEGKTSKNSSAFKEWDLKLVRCTNIKENTTKNSIFEKLSPIKVKEEKYTLKQMIKDHSDLNSYFFFNSSGYLIKNDDNLNEKNPNKEDPLLMTEPGSTILLHFHNSDDINKGFNMPFCLDKNMTMEGITNFLNKKTNDNNGCDGLLFTKEGQEVNIKNTLNRNKDDLINFMYYSAAKPEKIVVSEYQPIVEWNFQNEKNSSTEVTIEGLQPYDTLEDLLKAIFFGKADLLKSVQEVCAYKTTTYKKEKFKTTKLIDLDRGHGKIMLTIVKLGDQNKPKGGPKYWIWAVDFLGIFVILGLSVWAVISQKSKQLLVNKK